MHIVPVENLLSDNERRRLEVVRLVSLARDLLVLEREQAVRTRLDMAIRDLWRLEELSTACEANLEIDRTNAPPAMGHGI
jgi:hypothetical protein